jgi:hypothetical protein
LGTKPGEYDSPGFWSGTSGSLCEPTNPVQWANYLNIWYFVFRFRGAENAGIYREISMIVLCAYFLIHHVCGKADSLSEQVTFRLIMIENGYRQNKDLKPGPSLC